MKCFCFDCLFFQRILCKYVDWILDNKSKLKVINCFILSPLVPVSLILIHFDENFLFYLFLFHKICPTVCTITYIKHVIYGYLQENFVSSLLLCSFFSLCFRWKLSLLDHFCISMIFPTVACLNTHRWRR